MAASKSIKPIEIWGSKGMDNLPRSPANLLDQTRQMTPQVLLNADVSDGGVLKCRGGFKLLRSLANCHSLAGAEKGLSVMLCVAQGIAFPQSLFQIEEAGAQELGPVSGPSAQVSYAEINNRVYMANPYWTGVLNLITGEKESWGVPLPVAPQISLVEGDLPPVEYRLCYTNRIGDRESGNGPLVAIRWEGGTYGIQLNNLPAGASVWMTQPNGKDLFSAPVSSGVISGIAPDLQPLPSFMVQPPPGFSHLVYALGRIWGIRGRRLYYSDPGLFDWFRPKN